MGVSPWISCFWPGLPRLWWRGDWSGLLIAALFGLALNVSLVETFLTPENTSAGWKVGIWGVLAIFWLVCFRRGRWLFANGRWGRQAPRRALATHRDRRRFHL